MTEPVLAGAREGRGGASGMRERDVTGWGPSEESMKGALRVCLGACAKVGAEGQWRRLRGGPSQGPFVEGETGEVAFNICRAI